MKLWTVIKCASVLATTGVQPVDAVNSMSSLPIWIFLASLTIIPSSIGAIYTFHISSRLYQSYRLASRPTCPRSQWARWPPHWLLSLCCELDLGRRNVWIQRAAWIRTLMVQLHSSSGIYPRWLMLKNQARQFLDYVIDHQAADSWLGPETTRQKRGIWARSLLFFALMVSKLSPFLV